jgi:adenylate kinase
LYIILYIFIIGLPGPRAKDRRERERERERAAARTGGRRRTAMIASATLLLMNVTLVENLEITTPFV